MTLGLSVKGKHAYHVCEHVEKPKVSMHDTRVLLSKIMLLSTLVCLVCSTIVFADDQTGRIISDGDALTTLFATEAFQGSMSTIAKVPFIGALLSGIISISCLIGLVVTCFGIIMSMLYLSARNLFDRVHELKSTGKGSKFFGFGAMGKEVFNGNYGVGLDAIVGFILSLLPDVKEYSYFKEGSEAFNLNENETVTTFILKISLPTILTIFFFSIGFNGVLWQMYGVVVDAMGVGAEAFVDTELSQCVERALNTGANYQFAFSSSGTVRGKKCQEIAAKLYRQAKKNTADLSTEELVAIGSTIDKWVTENFYTNTGDWVDVLGFNAEDDSDFENMRYSIVINTSKSDLSISDNAYDVHGDASEILGVGISNGSTENTVHVIVQRVVKAKAPNYFTVKEESGGGGKGNGTDGTGTLDSPTFSEDDF